MAYALPSDCYSRKDTRILADLVLDNDARAGDINNVPLMQAALDISQPLLDILEDASGVINSFTLQGQRYSVADLQGLTGDDKAFLVWLTVSLAFGMLVLRRGNVKEQDLPPEYKQALEALQRLKEGGEVFNVQAALDAGIPASYFPALVSYPTLNLFRDYASRYFPSRRQQNNVSH